MKRLAFLLVLLCVVPVEAKTISVGYHKNLRGWFTESQFAALDSGRQYAQREWAKYCNLTWTGAVYPNVTIKPASDPAAWGRAPLYGSWISVSIDAKFRYAWDDENTWKSLFIHEFGHILGMPDGGGSGNVMTITGSRPLTPSAAEIAWVQKRYGKPPTPPPPPPVTVFNVNGTPGADNLKVAVGIVKLGEAVLNVPAGTKTIVFDGKGGMDKVLVLLDVEATVVTKGGKATITLGP